jgi:hypothetical protein
MTQAQYDASNETTDDADGWRIGSSTTSPYTAWSSAGITQAIYEAGNTTSAETDGWRTSITGAPTSWVPVSQSLYNESNETNEANGSVDGWRTTTTWATTSMGTYDTSNSNTGESDLWRTRVNGSLASGWTPVTAAQYTASNTTGDDVDGWRLTKVYAPTYTAYDANTTKTIENWQTVGNFVVNNTTGNGGGFTMAQRTNPGNVNTPFDDTGEYTNAPVADLFVLPSYADFNKAMKDIALGQCGGTVTIQTRINATAALDPFTYQNMTTLEVVKTSAAYRSGTFDVALPGGSATTVTISPQEFTSLNKFKPVSWSCKSAGVAVPFVQEPVPDHAPWTSIKLTVAPNQAVSCIQQVDYA